MIDKSFWVGYRLLLGVSSRVFEWPISFETTLVVGIFEVGDSLCLEDMLDLCRLRVQVASSDRQSHPTGVCSDIYFPGSRVCS